MSITAVRTRLLICLAGLVLLLAGGAALAQTPTTPQRPFSQLAELWTRQLDRISDRVTEPGLLVTELDQMRDQAGEVRTAALATAALARTELAETRALLAPLEAKTGSDPVNESDAVKAERARLLQQAAIAEGRVKQSEVVIARADLLIERMTRIRGNLLLQTLTRKVASPLAAQVWQRLGGELSAATASLNSAFTTWMRRGVLPLGSGDSNLLPLAFWAVATIALWWMGRALRKRFGRGDTSEPGQRDRAFVAAIEGLGQGLVPILAVWLVGQLFLASIPPPLIAALITEILWRTIVAILVFGLSGTMLAPQRAEWRVLPFTEDSARVLSHTVRRLVLTHLVVDFVYTAATLSTDQHDAIISVGALIVSGLVAFLALPVLATNAWHAARPEGSDLPSLVGGPWWTGTRGFLSVAVLAPIVFALLGYSVLATHLHAALAGTFLAIAVALLAHRMVADLLDAAAAPDTPTGQWVRQRFGLPTDAKLRGQLILLLLFDLGLVALLGVAIPAAWGADIDNILTVFYRLLAGIKVGGVTISLTDIGGALIAFSVVLLMAHLLRGAVGSRIMPTLDAPLPLRQSVDAALNYVGLLLAFVVGITALGVDFTNLAIVLGALSVGIGLGLQNIANNVISGVILLIERPIKAGDWVAVGGHEGFVKRINVRATEIETFQRTSVIVPNSMFLQNAVINRTYSDTSSRVEIALTVGYDSDVTRVEAILREAALSHQRVLRVPPPVVRFLRLGQHGLEFELFAFVARLEDRLIVSNDLNRIVLQKILEAGIALPFRGGPTDVRVRGLEPLAEALGGRKVDHTAAPPAADGPTRS